MSENSEKFILRVQEAMKEGNMVKITVSKPVKKDDELKNVYVKPVLIKNNKMYSFVYRYERRDETKNYDQEQTIENLKSLLEVHFLNATLFTLNEDITLLIGDNGKSRLLSKAVCCQREQNLEHDRQKSRLINPENPWWFKLGLTTREGKVVADMQHKFKQICKYVEIVAGVMKPLHFDEPVFISDMGAGKGYLTFALYEYLTKTLKLNVDMTGVEIRPDLVAKINETIRESQMAGFKFVESAIEDYTPERMDIMIALHACDTATDDAIAKGILSNAKLLVCAPCCHKQVRQEMEKSGITDAITRHGIFMERQASMVTDAIRALAMECFGYKTQVMEFIETEHTPKNILLVGVRTDGMSQKRKEAALSQIRELMQRYGVERQCLVEKLFGERSL